MGRKVKEDGRLATLRAEEPDIGDAGRICVAAIRDLESTRPPIPIALGMSGSVVISGAIPWPAVSAWCERRGLGLRETDIIAAVVRRLDVDHKRREHARVQEAARSKG